MNAPAPLLQASRRKTLHLGITYAILLVGSLIWALRSPSPSTITAAQPERATPAPHPAQAPLSLAAFSAPLWTSPAPAAETPPPAPQAPVAPLKLQLLAIHTDSSPASTPRLRASLFDPDTGRVHSVIRGDSISGREVIAIEPSRITLGPVAQPVSLLLRPGDHAR
jgi:hypothetical protein